MVVQALCFQLKTLLTMSQLLSDVVQHLAAAGIIRVAPSNDLLVQKIHKDMITVHVFSTSPCVHLLLDLLLVQLQDSKELQAYDFITDRKEGGN